MSYEGYEVIYCICGYRKATLDAHESYLQDKVSKDPCPICGSTEEAWDCVNLTNGCECDYVADRWIAEGHTGDPPMCSAHERVTKVIQIVGELICPCCKGKGTTPINRYDISMLRKRG